MTVVPAVVDLSPSAEDATEQLIRLYAVGWRVVGTLYYGDNANAVILERKLSAAEKPPQPLPSVPVKKGT